MLSTENSVKNGAGFPDAARVSLIYCFDPNPLYFNATFTR